MSETTQQSTSMGTVVTMPPPQSVAAPTPPPAAASLSSDQEEDLLRDVLEELDRERSKRAELESKLRKTSDDHAKFKEEIAALKLQQQRQANNATTSSSTSAHARNPQDDGILRSEFISMQAQLDGFRQLVDMLTATKPAVANVAGSKSSLSLPLHIVRLLEVMPWDASAQEYIFGTETLFEWQIYDSREHKWQSQLRHFPVLFKSLPVVKAAGNGQIVEKKDRSLLLFLAKGGGSASDKATSSNNVPSKHGTLTDERITMLYNMDAGFPLPQDKGTWQWIGGWRIERNIPSTVGGSSPSNVASTSSMTMATTTLSYATITKPTFPCDDQGWSYAKEGQHFLFESSVSMVFDHAGFPSTTAATAASTNSNIYKPVIPVNKIRRRRWTRRRMLIDYPCACESTKHYLRLLAENARLSLTVNKTSDQLVETKMILTETESELVRTQAELAEKTALIHAFAFNKEESLNSNSKGTTGDSGNALQDLLSKTEQVKEIGSKISQWVGSARKGSEDAPPTPETSHNLSVDSKSDTTQVNKLADSANIIQQSPSSDSAGFDWKMFGRGALLDRIKQSQVVASSHMRASSANAASLSPAANAAETINTDESNAVP